MALTDKALIFAAQKHAGMRRKLDSAPFILHPIEAAMIVRSMTDDEEVIAAALLHDTVEDTDATIDEIRERFGERVAFLVASETENKRPGLSKKDTWLVRKEESLRELESCGDIGVKYLWLADKLSNMRSLAAAWNKRGSKVFAEFNQTDRAKHAWYYRRIAELLSELSGCGAWKEYKELVDTVFAEEQKQ